MRRPGHKVVVVSNRGPFRMVASGTRRRRVRAAGGLVAALDPVLRQRGGVWVAAGETLAENVVDEEDERLPYQLATVELSRTDREGFYRGVSNAMLWPILHSLPPTVRITHAPWTTYEKANRAFRDEVLRASKGTDVIWIQDFHLMLLPAMVREKRARSRIGWFCHIPWPGENLFKILPWHRQILEGLLGADVIGFHTDNYAQNFLECVRRIVGCSVDNSRSIVRFKDRQVRVVVAPIGVPYDEIQTLAASPSVMDAADKIRRSVDGRRIILGVDRLDYTKGIPHRLLAFEQFLRSDRSARNRYVLMQIMVPSRTDVKAYEELKTDIDRLVGDINGRYSSAGRVPVQYFYRNLPPEQLYAHYCAADVAMVTPLRDGMNLVALEYVVCRSQGDGVLVLSEFAGASEYLAAALIVNPYDIHGLSDTLRDALAMSPEDAASRMHALRTQVHKLDVHRWADDFIEQLERAH